MVILEPAEFKQCANSFTLRVFTCFYLRNVWVVRILVPEKLEEVTVVIVYGHDLQPHNWGMLGKKHQNLNVLYVERKRLGKQQKLQICVVRRSNICPSVMERKA